MDICSELSRKLVICRENLRKISDIICCEFGWKQTTVSYIIIRLHYICRMCKQ